MDAWEKQGKLKDKSIKYKVKSLKLKVESKKFKTYECLKLFVFNLLKSSEIIFGV